MSDQTQEPEDRTEQNLELDIDGRKIEVSLEDAARYAALGMNADQKIQEARTQVKENQKAIEIGKELLELSQRDPERAQRIVQIANGQDPDPSSNGSAAPSAPHSGIDADSLTEAEQGLLGRLQAMEARVVQAEKEAREARSKATNQEESLQQDRISRSIREQCGVIPTWDEGDAKEFEPDIAGYMQTNGCGVVEAVHAIAQRESRREKRRQERSLQSGREKRRFRTEAPSRGVPGAAKGPEYKKDDLAQGKVLQSVMDLASKIGLDSIPSMMNRKK